jgi:site-specific DNA-methyltransferase (adenine-specific)
MPDLLPLLSGAIPWQAVRGDALAVLSLLPPDSIDAFVSDPPYGIGMELGTAKRRTRIRGDGKAEARRLWERFVPLAARAARPDSAHWFFGTWKSPWMAEILAASFTLKGCAVWVKPQWGLGFYLRPRWELAYLAHKGRPPLPAKADCDVWEAARDNLTLHPCRKPVPLLRRAIRMALPVERRDPARPPLIVDPFAGVFSTGVAAVEEGCRFLGVELDARFCRTGEARLRAARGDQTT